MSWHCSRALVAEFLGGICSDGDASAPSNTTPTPEAYYWPDKTTEHSRLSRFGMTSEPLTESRGEELLTLYREAFPARTLAQPAPGLESTESAAGYGRKWPGLLARYDRDSSSWKTAQCSLVEGLDEFSETWPKWGSMRNGGAYQRPTPELRTSESASGLWPTPCARDYKLPGRSRFERTGSKAGEVLPQAVGGALNPNWAEWLMNWPLGWTSLEALNREIFEFWEKSSAAYFCGNQMREMWFNADPATPPRGQEPNEQCRKQCTDSLPEVPQRRPHDGWNLGERAGGVSSMQGLRLEFSSNTFAQGHGLQQGMFGRMGQDLRESPLGYAPRVLPVRKRVDRLKAIGNGQVSRVAATAFLELARRFD